jgi:hypothetical protein
MIAVLGRLEGVVPPDIQARIRESGDGLEGGAVSKEGISTDQDVIDDMDMEDGTPRAEDVST